MNTSAGTEGALPFSMNCRYPDFQHRFYPHLKHQQAEGVYCEYEDPLLALFVSSLFLAGIFGGEPWRQYKTTAAELLGIYCFGDRLHHSGVNQ